MCSRNMSESLQISWRTSRYCKDDQHRWWRYYCFPFLRGESYENNNLIFTEVGYGEKICLKSRYPSDSTNSWRYAVGGIQKLGVQTPRLRKDHVSRVLSPGFDSGWFLCRRWCGQAWPHRAEPKRLSWIYRKLYWGVTDNDYLSVDKNSQAVMVLNELCGATYAPGGSGIGTWLPAMQQSNPRWRWFPPVRFLHLRIAIPSLQRCQTFIRIRPICRNLDKQ